MTDSKLQSSLALTLKYFSIYCPKKKDLLLCSHKINVTLKKFNESVTLCNIEPIFQLFSFVLQNILYTLSFSWSKGHSKFTWCIWLLCVFSLFAGWTTSPHHHCHCSWPWCVWRAETVDCSISDILDMFVYFSLQRTKLADASLSPICPHFH